MAENRYLRRVQRRERAHAGSVPRAAVSRVRFLLLALLAVAIQVFVVQTHVHVPQAGAPGFSGIAISSGPAISPDAAFLKTNPAPSKTPFSDDNANCPVCQQIAHCNQFVQSASLLATLPGFIALHAFPKIEAALSSVTLTHPWKSRAPPRFR